VRYQVPQDQLFKDLLREFFREFLELFYPDVAAHLDFTRVTFLDKETFTDLPEGSQRTADLVARVYSVEGEPELILVHVEVESQRRGEFPYRMWEYYSLLRLRHKIPVFPVVVYLAPGAGGLVEESYRETLFSRNILTFQYQAVGLPDLASDDYLERDNPLGPALGALMRPGKSGRALRWALGLRQKAVVELDEARRSLLINLMQMYLPLNVEEEAEFRRIVGQPEFEEVKQVVTIFEQRGIEQGKRDTLLRQLRRKFGDLPQDFVTKIEAVTAEAELDTLLERILTANSLDEMGLSPS
jgi:hypothetical protein